MLSIFGKKSKSKSKKKLSKSQIEENWDIVHKRVSCIYKELRTINSDLNQITQHNSFIKTSSGENKMLQNTLMYFMKKSATYLRPLRELKMFMALKK